MQGCSSIDSSLAFNNIIPDILVSKLSDLDLTLPTCPRIKEFLTNRLKIVKLASSSPPPSRSASSLHKANTIIKFADDTTVVSLISRGEESAYRDDVQKNEGTHH